MHFKRTAIAAAIVAQCVMLAACGGGGGGSETLPKLPDDGWTYPPPGDGSGGGSGDGSGGGETQLPAPVPPSYTMSYGWQPMGIYAAHQLDGTQDGQGNTLNTKGQGVTIAVVDTGFDREGAAQFFGDRLLDGFDATTGDGRVETDADESKHGTDMARVAAGAGQWANGSPTTIGVAPEANIYPVKAMTDGDGALDHTTEAFQHLADQAVIANYKIVNMSFGDPSMLTPEQVAQYKALLQPLVDGGKLLVASAGNWSHDDPAAPARFAADPEFLDKDGAMLSVGAINGSDYSLAGYSHKAGVAKDRHLVAIVPVNLGEYDESNSLAGDWIAGTSPAAAIVSGAAAVVWGRWPYLKGERVARILLETAEDLGEQGVDEIYGWGLLRLDRAMQPQGDLLVQSIKGDKLALGSSSAGTLSAQSYALLQSSGIKVQAYDKYERNFAVSAAAIVGKEGAVGADKVRDAVAQQVQPVVESSASGASFAWAGAEGRSQPFARLGFSGNGWGAFAFNGARFAPQALYMSPVVGHLSRASGFGAHVDLGGALTFTGALTQGTALRGENLTLAQTSLAWGAGAWRAQATVGAGVARLDGWAGQDRRQIAQLQLGYAVSPASTVSVAWNVGARQQTLQSGFGGASEQLKSVTLRWEADDVTVRGSRAYAALTLGRGATQRLSLDLPTGVDLQTGAPLFERVNLVGRSRAASGLELGYSAPLGRQANLSVSAAAGSESGGALTVRWSRRF